MANSVEPDQGAVCSGSTLFASILNCRYCKAIICSRRLQQTIFSDTFFLGALRVKETYYTIIDFNEVDIRIYLPEKVIIHRGR